MPVASSSTVKTSWSTNLKCKFCYNNLKSYYSPIKNETFFRCVNQGCCHCWWKIRTPTTTDFNTEI